MAAPRRSIRPGDPDYLWLKRIETRVKQVVGQENNPTLQALTLWMTDELRRSLEASDWPASERHLRRLQRMLTDGRRLLSRQP
jgi:hypothetical protein